MGIFRTGWSVAIFLAVLTIVEFVFAVNIDNAQIRFAGLALAAAMKVYLIAVYFMHIRRVWGGEGAH